MALNLRQIAQLLQPINPKRVLRDGKGMAHVAQQDVTAHLSRVFGFTGWDKAILHEELIFESERLNVGKPSGRWDCAYRVRIRLIIKDPEGNVVTTKEDGSVGVAQNQVRGDAHDLAYKSAISLALKRCAKDLGDQFGLSLYSKGDTNAIVKATLVGMDAPEDVEAEVEVTSLSHDEASVDDADAARDELRELCAQRGWDLKAIAQAFTSSGNETSLKDAGAEEVRAYINLLKQNLVAV